MNEFEERARAVLEESLEGIDMRVRSRLTQARSAALAAAANTSRWAWLLRVPGWTPAVGVTAVAVLAAALWFATPLGNHGMSTPDSQPNLEDLDIVASSDEGSGDAMEMLQDDVEFYDWADKATSSGTATSG
jgi:hypothetical protein